jgi:hypothetical protein
MNQLGVFFNAKKTPQIYKMTGRLRPEAEGLIIGMLQACPHARLSMPEILNHSYFSKYNHHTPTHNNNNNNTNEDQFRCQNVAVASVRHRPTNFD